MGTTNKGNDIPVPDKQDWGDVTSRECGRIGGKIGGKMVRDMIQIAEQQLADRQ